MKNVSVYDEYGQMTNLIINIDIFRSADEFKLVSTIYRGVEDVINRTKKEKIDVLIICMYKSDENAFEELSTIVNALSGVDVIVISYDKDYLTVRECFIRGVFDYLVVPFDENELEKTLIRTNTLLDMQIILLQLQDMIDALIEDLFKGYGQYEYIIRDIINRIYNDYKNNRAKYLNVLFNAKQHIYNQLIAKKPWLEKFIYKQDFAVKYNFSIESMEKVNEEWIRVFREISDIIEKYKMIDDKLVYNIGKYVILHVDEKLSLEKVANEVFLNPSYVSHLFKKITGMKFMDYILEVKVDRAKILMRDTHLKVYEISSIIGYDNPEYFARIFKRKTGLIPVDYMKMIQEKYKN